MTEAEYEDLIRELQRLIADYVDEHPLTRNLRPVAKRNMAYGGAHAACSSLTAEDLELPNSEVA